MERAPFDLASEKEITQATDFWNTYLADWVYNNIPRWYESQRQEKIAFEIHKTQITGTLLRRLELLASKLKLPLESILLTAHCKVISIVSGNTDITTGYELDDKLNEKGSLEIGIFNNTLPLRIKCENDSWLSLLKTINSTTEEILRFRFHPISKVESFKDEASHMYETSFKFSTNTDFKNSKEFNQSDTSKTKLRVEEEFAFRTHFNLSQNKLDLKIQYNSNEFSKEQISAISEYYLNTLELIVSDEEALHKTQSILSTKEQYTLLESFNSNIVDFPEDKTFVEIFERQVKNTPNATAVQFESVEWTYEELNNYANKLANHFIASKLVIEDAIVVVMERTNFWMATVLGILKAGLVYVPVDPEWPETRKKIIINKTKAKYIVVDNKSKNELSVLIKEYSNKPKLIIIEDDLENFDDQQNPSRRALPENLAYIIFTSGSTGEPKGAMIEHKGMLNHLYSKVNDLRLNANDIVAQNSSQCFDISVWQLISGLLVGAKTVIYSNNLILNILEFLRYIKEDNVTILELVPSYMKIVLKLSNHNNTPFDNLRYLLVTGEPLKIGLVTSWFNFFKNIPLVNAYGPTEASDDITHHFMYDTPKDGLVPVGKPIQNLNIYVVDKFNQLVPIGTKGEVYVSGVGVGRGYIGEVEKTKAAFSIDNFKPNKKLKLYKTGDVGSWTPKGILHLYGREDNQIKLNGYRIDLGEIEQCLSKQDGVADNAVLLKEKQLQVFLTFESTTKNEQELIEQCKSRLRKDLPYYMVPRKFHLLKNLPLTPNGKIDRKALQKTVIKKITDA